MSPQVALFKKDRSIGFTTSIVLHGALLLIGGFIFVKPIDYGVESGSGGVEISLTAAPAEIVTDEEVMLEEAPPAPEAIVKDPEEMALSENKPEALKAVKEKEEKKVNAAVSPAEKGDGSSAIPGRDQTTFYSLGGALTEAKPNYLRNPAPAYPRVAREKGWQGVVLLKVSVDKSGHAASVEKEKSSGYDILDQSALKTVRDWRFRPAQVGALPVESVVLVPVRFTLESKK